MSNSENKTFIKIPFACEHIAKLDYYAKNMGLTRAALCAYFVRQELMRMDKSCAFLALVASEFDEVFNYV